MGARLPSRPDSGGLQALCGTSNHLESEDHTIRSSCRQTVAGRCGIIGSRTSATGPRRQTGESWDGREDVPGIPTILSADDPLGYYVRAELLPDGRWEMTWRRLDVRAE